MTHLAKKLENVSAFTIMILGLLELNVSSKRIVNHDICHFQKYLYTRGLQAYKDFELPDSFSLTAAIVDKTHWHKVNNLCWKRHQIPHREADNQPFMKPLGCESIGALSASYTHSFSLGKTEVEYIKFMGWSTGQNAKECLHG